MSAIINRTCLTGFWNPPPDPLYIVVAVILALAAALQHVLMHGGWR